eukprot:4537563-Prymnesium_polylepis.2
MVPAGVAEGGAPMAPLGWAAAVVIKGGGSMARPNGGRCAPPAARGVAESTASMEVGASRSSPGSESSSEVSPSRRRPVGMVASHSPAPSDSLAVNFFSRRLRSLQGTGDDRLRMAASRVRIASSVLPLSRMIVTTLRARLKSASKPAVLSILRCWWCHVTREASAQEEQRWHAGGARTGDERAGGA